MIGVGGCGGNAVDHMVSQSVDGVEFIAANTDLQALGELDPAITMQIGAEVTKGLGAGANPDVGPGRGDGGPGAPAGGDRGCPTWSS